MKKFKFQIAFLSLLIVSITTIGQVNPTMGVLPANSGIVAVGSTLDLQITVGNTGSSSIPANKIRPVITVPNLIVTLLPNVQQTGLPVGWSIVTNDGTQIRICNGTDVIPSNANRTIFIKVIAIAVGGPSTFVGQITFGSATTCANAGPTVTGNNTADDNATSTITVIAAPVPLTLLTFSASLYKCEPTLNWVTESEINTDRFEIERSNANGNDWKSLGTVPATGSGSIKTNYSFTDNNTTILTDKILYRLKMLDKDGKFKYSKILPVLVNCNVARVSVYPNPVVDERLYVSITGTAGFTEATLMSVSGQVILKAKMINGTNSINITGIADGIYVLSIKDEKGFQHNTKVVVKH